MKKSLAESELLAEAREVARAALASLERVDTAKLAARGLDMEATSVSDARRFLDIVLRRESVVEPKGRRAQRR